MTRSRRLPIALAPVGIAAVVTGFVLLFGGDDEVTRVAVVNRAVGGSFIACGLVAWWQRPDNGTGPLMTTASVAPKPLPAPVCAGSRIGWRRWAGACAW